MSVMRGVKNALAAPGALALLQVMVLLGLSACCAPSAAANPGIADIDDAEELPSVELLLERYVEAVGGRDAVLGLRDRVAEMRRVTDLQWETHIHEVDTLTVYGRSSGEYLVVTRSERGIMKEGSDGSEEWKIDFDGSVSHRTMGPRDRWMTDPQFPLRMRQHFPVMKVLGVDVWGRDIGGGDRVYVVETDGDESHRLGFDVETGLLTRLGYNIELRDYREADGVLMPMQVAVSRKGGSSTFFVDAVEHNARIDPALFSVPR